MKRMRWLPVALYALVLAPCPAGAAGATRECATGHRRGIRRSRRPLPLARARGGRRRGRHASSTRARPASASPAAASRSIADTLFKVASNTKSMTTATLARLVDAGQAALGRPGRAPWLPQFRMYDAWVSREMQVRDLLIHNSGLRAGAGDLMLWPEPNDFNRADVIHGLAYLKPVYSFRSRLRLRQSAVHRRRRGRGRRRRRALRNTVATRGVRAAGHVALPGRRSGTATEVGNVAQPHMRQGERNVPVRSDGDVIPATHHGPGRRRALQPRRHAALGAAPGCDRAGAVANWLSRDQRHALWTPQMPMPLSRPQRDWDDSHFSAYGYGWRLADVDGMFKVSHTGTLMGMYSAVTLLPDQNVGFVILTNGEGDDARTVLTAGAGQALHRTDPTRTVRQLRRRTGPEDARRCRRREGRPTLPRRQPATVASSWRRPGRLPRSLVRRGLVVPRSASACASRTQVADADRRRAARRQALAGGLGRRQRRCRGLARLRRDRRRGSLTMAKVDPQADFSYDYEDLAFTRTGGCA